MTMSSSIEWRRPWPSAIRKVGVEVDWGRPPPCSREVCGGSGEQVRERTRSVVRRVFEIAQRSRTTGSRARPGCEQSQAKMKVLYQGLMRITRTVVRHAVADGGFASRTNERFAHDRGVHHVVLPRLLGEPRSRIAPRRSPLAHGE
jgi:hypothetical protein